MLLATFYDLVGLGEQSQTISEIISISSDVFVKLIEAQGFQFSRITNFSLDFDFSNLKKS